MSLLRPGVIKQHKQTISTGVYFIVQYLTSYNALYNDYVHVSHIMFFSLYNQAIILFL